MPQVTGPLTTTSSSDTFPTHDSLLQLGGFREVADTTARNSIPNARRRAGMLVYTIADDKYWRLLASPWAGTAADWVAASLGGGTGGSSAATSLKLTDSNNVVWTVSVSTAGRLITTSNSTNSSVYGTAVYNTNNSYVYS